MNAIPTPSDVRARLSALTHAQMQLLSEVTAVPFTTLWKVRSGETMNPRLETVHAIWPELIGKTGAPLADAAPASQQGACDAA